MTNPSPFAPFAIAQEKAQQTLKKSIEIVGRGLFTGCEVCMRLIPTEENTGVVFKRTDLPGQPLIPATLSSVVATLRCTTLGVNDARVQTVEHFLSALCMAEIDNLIIEIDAEELPIFDGSSLPFLSLIEDGGVEIQNEKKNQYVIEQPLYWSQGEIQLIALPSDSLRISYTLSYPKDPLLQAQFVSFPIDYATYKKEIAPSRTFALFEEIEAMVKGGLLKGGGLECGLVIRDGVPLNPEGTRFPQEMARHKVLDLIGDLSLMQSEICAHIIAIKSGHSSNIEFARLIQNFMEMPQ